MGYYYYGRDSVYNPYFIISSSTRLPLDLSLVKRQLSIPGCDKSQDDLLISYIRSAALQAEKYTSRILLNKTFLTTRNCFPSLISMRRSVFKNLIRFEYKVNGVLTPVPFVYQIVPENDYSKIVLLPNEQWPANIDKTRQAIEIEFVAGYGEKSDDIPEDLKNAMLNQIAGMYSNRGDCSCGTTSSSKTSNGLSQTSQMIYDSYRIRNLTGIESG